MATSMKSLVVCGTLLILLVAPPGAWCYKSGGSFRKYTRLDLTRNSGSRSGMNDGSFEFVTKRWPEEEEDVEKGLENHYSRISVSEPEGTWGKNQLVGNGDFVESAGTKQFAAQKFPEALESNVGGKKQESLTEGVTEERADRRLSFPEDNRDERDLRAKFKNWNIVDDAEDVEKAVVWPKNGGSITPDGKTIPLPGLPSLNIVEDPGYDHGRPVWPLNEYSSGNLNGGYYQQNRPGWAGGGGWGSLTRQNSSESSSSLTNIRDYEWQKLPHYGSGQGGTGLNYDSSKYYHLDDDRLVGNSLENTESYRNGGRKYNLFRESDSQKATNTLDGHATTVSTGIKTAESNIRGTGKHGLPPGIGGGAPPHYFPPDYYPKKKFRLKIHPAYIAAPIAGLAAFGAASALTKKPLLFELGLVNNKHHYPLRPGHYPGHAWPSNNIPVLASPLGGGVTGPGEGEIGGPVLPILKPEASQHYGPDTHPNHFHHYHHHNHKHHVKPLGHHLVGEHHLSSGWGGHKPDWSGQHSHQLHVQHGWDKPGHEHKPGTGWGHEQKPGTGWGHEQKPGWGHEQKPGWGHEQKPGWGHEQKPGWGHEQKPGWGHEQKPGWGHEQKPGWGHEHHKPQWGWGHEHHKPQWGWGHPKPTQGCCSSHKPTSGWGSGSGGDKKPWWNLFAITPKH